MIVECRGSCDAPETGSTHLISSVFSATWLDEHVLMLLHQYAARFQLRFGRSQRKAQRQRVLLTSASVPARDQFVAVVVAGLRRIAQKLGAVAIHQHLACDHAQIARLAFREERIGGLLVHLAVDERGRRAARQQFVDKKLAVSRATAGFSKPRSVGKCTC